MISWMLCVWNKKESRFSEQLALQLLEWREALSSESFLYCFDRKHLQYCDLLNLTCFPPFPLFYTSLKCHSYRVSCSSHCCNSHYFCLFINLFVID